VVIGLAGGLGRVSRFRLVRAAWAAYVVAMRGIPVLVTLMFLYYGLPSLGIQFTAYTVAILGLSITNGAYVTEIVRAGIQSIDRGQMHAARSLGMSYLLAMRRIILPQAFRRILPPLTNEAITLLKSTSLVSAIAISELLRVRHGIGADDTDDFSIFDQAQLLEVTESISGTLTLLLAGIASIALVVGGIGIMNIMLVSVRERTREIGIRKAVGARDRDVLAQFLIEALTLSLLGGLVGTGIGLLTSAAIGSVAGWGFTFNPLTVVVALAFSLGIGVIFGVWPARQAARLDPINALRYE